MGFFIIGGSAATFAFPLAFAEVSFEGQASFLSRRRHTGTVNTMLGSLSPTLSSSIDQGISNEDEATGVAPTLAVVVASNSSCPMISKYCSGVGGGSYPEDRHCSNQTVGPSISGSILTSPSSGNSKPVKSKSAHLTR